MIHECSGTGSELLANMTENFFPSEELLRNSARNLAQRALAKCQDDIWPGPSSKEKEKSKPGSTDEKLPPLTPIKTRELAERKFKDGKVTYAKFDDGKFHPIEVWRSDNVRTTFKYDKAGKLTGYVELDADGHKTRDSIDLSQKHLKATVSDAGLLEIRNIYTGAQTNLERNGNFSDSLGVKLKADIGSLLESGKESDVLLGLGLIRLSADAFNAESAADAKGLANNCTILANDLEKAGYKDDAHTLRMHAKRLAK
ncbi:MAG: hypothetical protein C5B53_03425 [Candidatus Melainabacteria bacterium]|nr:MAG: hypothetical protein C5B53_03425 [Candidatus Melainabacteria bacterium]